MVSSARRSDQQAGKGDEAGEALGPDHRLRAPVGAAAAVGLDRRAVNDLGDLERSAVALGEQVAPGLGLLGKLGGLEQLRVVAPAEHPGDELERRRVLGLEDHPLAAGLVGLGRGPELAVGAEVTLDEPGDPLSQKDLGGALDLAHLPVGSRCVVAAVEVLGRREVVLSLRRVGDLALDPREAEDADVVALVRVPDQIELAVAEDEVVGVDLAVGGLVALQRVVAELDRLAARDRGLDLGELLRDVAAGAVLGELDVDRRRPVALERARPAPGDLLQREAQRLGVGELAVEQAERSAKRRQLGVGELDRGQVVVLRRQRVELGLEEALGRLLDRERDPEALELGAVGIEAAGEGVVVHRAVALDLALDLERRDGAPAGHQERDQGELADQLLGVLGHRA